MTRPLYAFDETGEEAGRVLGELKAENPLLHMDKLLAAGIVWREEVNANVVTDANENKDKEPIASGY